MQKAKANTAAGSAATDNNRQISKPTIGRLVLLQASYIKPNQPLVNNEDGAIEIVSKDKFFSPEKYSRYYIITEETPTQNNLVYYQTSGEDADLEAGICMYADKPSNTICFVCYPAANSIVSRLHAMYYTSITAGNEEYLRFAKIHGNKYAGFPLKNPFALPAGIAKERWDYIFQHVLMTNPTNLRKKRIGVLFGSIAGADLANKDTIELLNKYRAWIIN